MHLFTFEPGDGYSYRVLFGRLPSQTPLIPFYTVFGFGEFGDALITVVFDTDQIDYDTFYVRWHTAMFTNAIATPGYLCDAAWALFAALTRSRNSANDPLGWRDDWRRQIPPAALG